MTPLPTLPLLVARALVAQALVAPALAAPPDPEATSPVSPNDGPTAPAARAAPEMVPLDAFNAAADPVVKDFELPLLAGGSFHLAEHKGKPVVLSFWASWCGPCRKELPALSAFAGTHPELTFIAVNVDRDRAAADKFLGSVAVNLPIAFDPDAKALGSYGVTSMPTLFVIDRKGQLHWRHAGYGEEKGLTELEAALGELR